MYLFMTYFTKDGKESVVRYILVIRIVGAAVGAPFLCARFGFLFLQEIALLSHGPIVNLNH